MLLSCVLMLSGCGAAQAGTVHLVCWWLAERSRAAQTRGSSFMGA
jgi:hypothetical protein